MLPLLPPIRPRRGTRAPKPCGDPRSPPTHHAVWSGPPNPRDRRRAGPPSAACCSNGNPPCSIVRLLLL
eukprot:1637264-Pyramimonas_sp.AAC.1